MIYILEVPISEHNFDVSISILFNSYSVINDHQLSYRTDIIFPPLITL